MRRCLVRGVGLIGGGVEVLSLVSLFFVVCMVLVVVYVWYYGVCLWVVCVFCIWMCVVVIRVWCLVICCFVFVCVSSGRFWFCVVMVIYDVVMSIIMLLIWNYSSSLMKIVNVVSSGLEGV